MLAWLSDFGAGNPDISVRAPDFEPSAMPRASGQQARKPVKRRAADTSEGPPRRRTGSGKAQQDEHGISSEVQVCPCSPGGAFA